MASYVGQINSGGSNLPVASTLYGTCETAANTAEKVVTCANFDKLLTGVTIHVKFTYSNTVANPTLNVNSTGAKSIYRYGTTTPGTAASSSWNAGAVVSFTYDGSAWQMNDWVNTDANDNTKVTQTNSTTSADNRLILSATADDTTRTETAVKSTNFRANPNTGEFYAKGFRRIDITGQTVNINDYNLSAGTPNMMFYIEKTDGGANNITNIPVAGKPFLLDVEVIRWASASDYITRQTFRNANNPANEYVRFCTAGTWGSWTTRVFTDTKYAADTTSIGSASGWSAGTVPTLGTAIAADDITSWSAGSLPTLGTAISADDITAWTTNTATTPMSATASEGVLTFTAGSKGTAASLSYTSRSIPNVTGVGTLPSLSYTARSIPNVTAVGTAPSLTVTSKTVATGIHTT